MYDNQLEFNSPSLNNYILIENTNNDNENNYYDANRNKFIAGSNENYKKNEKYDLPEQLDYLLQPNYNFFPNEKPNPLIYNARSINPKTKNKLKSTKNNKNKPSAYTAKSNKSIKPYSQINNKINLASNINNNNTNKNFSLNTNIIGLFDPGMKKNELGLNKRQEVIRQDRLDKIKNYNIKFGKKVQNLEMYSNVEDMLEGIKKNKIDASNQMFLKKFKKTEIKKTKDKNASLGPNINYVSNNLDFNFDKQEVMIQSLEKQIENERKMRTV